MENARKYIWSVYLILWIYFIFFDSSYEHSDHVIGYLLFGWIPFLILHFLWRKSKTTENISTDNMNQSQQTNMEQVDAKYKLLFKIIERKEILHNAENLAQFEQAMAQAERELTEFYSQIGKDAEFFNTSDDMLELDAKILEKYWKLTDIIHEVTMYKGYLEKYFRDLEEISNKLEEGLGIKDAEIELKNLQIEDAKELSGLQVKLAISKAISEEMLALKHKHGKNLENVKVNMDDIKKRIYEKHPEWKGE